MKTVLAQLIRQAELCQNEPYQLEVLQEGLSQQCFELKTTKQSYVIKQFNDKRNFEIELCIYRALDAHDLCASLITSVSQKPHDYLILEKFAGQSLTSVSSTDADKLLLSSQLLAKFHHQLSKRSNKPPAELHPLDLNDVLLNLLNAAQLEQKKQQDISNIIQQSLCNLQNHNTNHLRIVCCHGDFNFSNILVSDDKSIVIDFESASLMPAEFDIAMMLAVNELEIEVIAEACRTYQQQTESFDRTRSLDGQYHAIELNHQLIQDYYVISILINGLWYLSKSIQAKPHSNSREMFLEKARAQFKLSCLTKLIAHGIGSDSSAQI